MIHSLYEYSFRTNSGTVKEKLRPEKYKVVLGQGNEEVDKEIIRFHKCVKMILVC
jgi:hypothetical protein